MKNQDFHLMKLTKRKFKHRCKACNELCLNQKELNEHLEYSIRCRAGKYPDQLCIALDSSLLNMSKVSASTQSLQWVSASPI